MYALFPNEARTYLENHQKGAESAVFMMGTEGQISREEEAVDVGQIRDLIRTLETSDVAEVVIEEGDTKITLRKPSASPIPTAPVVTQSAPEAAFASPASHVGAPESSRPSTWKTVIAPMVGTFYASPSPEAPVYCSVGDCVEAGNALCIVEAMKLMNEIEMPEMGVIKEIPVSNGEAVEYGTVLFYYE